jgi:hypothetical protein
MKLSTLIVGLQEIMAAQGDMEVEVDFTDAVRSEGWSAPLCMVSYSERLENNEKVLVLDAVYDPDEEEEADNDDLG